MTSWGANAALEDHVATQSRLLRIGKYDSDCEVSAYSVDFELAPSVRIVMECGSLETTYEGWDETDGGTINNEREGGGLGMQDVDRSHRGRAARVAPARPSSPGSREKLQVRMVSVLLRRHDRRSGDIDPQFDVVLDAPLSAPSGCRPIYIQTVDALETETVEFQAALHLSITSRRRLREGPRSSRRHQMILVEHVIAIDRIGCVIFPFEIEVEAA